MAPAIRDVQNSLSLLKAHVSEHGAKEGVPAPTTAPSDPGPEFHAHRFGASDRRDRR
ncbi:hypothetical protein PWG71_07535 [Nocardiopsis sp. N85]|uniref:hypothetical protein n=1 Tax=Nocardiopsis sp. N85 TaxID=3029400 RepID=UPI00237F1AD4|nr:hypothetical protein [Nocardiopsis sp. N85]MDE3721236.1 hypothetical protein [Nocardiopsis sp. N85]